MKPGWLRASRLGSTPVPAKRWRGDIHLVTRWLVAPLGITGTHLFGGHYALFPQWVRVLSP